MSETPADASRAIVLACIKQLTDEHGSATYQQIIDAAGISPHIVKERCDQLVNVTHEVERISRGVYRAIKAFARPRPISKTVLADGEVDCMVDHADGDILNNTPENLRKASNTENQFNQKIAARNVSGVKGVLWDKKAAQWRASIRHNGKRFQKNFRSIDEAAAWADEVRRGVHGEFARSE